MVGGGNAARVAWEGTGKGLVGTLGNTDGVPAPRSPRLPHELPFGAPACLDGQTPTAVSAGSGGIRGSPGGHEADPVASDGTWWGRALWGHGADAWGNDQDPLGDIWGAVGGQAGG